MDEALPLATIIISNLNGRDLLRGCLRSLYNLSYPNFEVIVVDAGSEDGSPDMVEAEFPRTRVERVGNMGIGEAINIGIARSNGDVVVFDLNNDDVVSEDWLNHLVRALMRSREVGVVGGKRFLGDTGRLDSAGSRIILGVTVARGHGKPGAGAFLERRQVDYVSVLATRRDVLDSVGPLDETFYIYGEDPDFCIRARKAGYTVEYIPDAVLWHQHSATIGERTPRRLYYLARSRIRLIRKHRPAYQKLPLLLLHATLVPVLYILVYSAGSPRKLARLVKAQWDAFAWNFRQTQL